MEDVKALLEKYDGIPHKKYSEYSSLELEALPDIPSCVPGEDYPENYSEPPLYWNGYRWIFIFD